MPAIEGAEERFRLVLYGVIRRSHRLISARVYAAYGDVFIALSIL